MERVSRFLEITPSSSQTAVVNGVRGKAEYVRLALACLVDEGHVATSKDGQAIRHSVARPYREADPTTPEEAP